MMDLFPSVKVWWMQRGALRDLRRRTAEAREVNRFTIKDELTYAISALERGDRPYATAIWNRLTTEFPVEVRSSPLALRVLLGLRRFDEAKALMRDGQRRKPSDPRFLMGLGQIAQALGDHADAINIYSQLRKRFPGVMEGYTAASESLRATNQLSKAEELASKAMHQFSDQIHPFLEYARIAAARKDWEEALRRWHPVREKFGYFGGYVGSAQALSQLGRFDEADELLQQARYRFGTDSGPLTEYARVAEIKGDTPEAIKRWQSLLARFPLEMHVYFAVSEALERLGQSAEAEATLRAAIDRFPTEAGPGLELAKLLHHRRRNFNAAVQAWAALRTAFPEHEEAYSSGVDALRHAGNLAEADALREEQHRRFKQNCGGE